MGYLEVFRIRPGETRTMTIDFSEKLPTGLGFAASGHSVASVDKFSGQSDASILGSLTPSVSGTDVSAVILNVGLGERYEVSFTLKMDDATPPYIVEKVLVMGVDVL